MPSEILLVRQHFHFARFLDKIGNAETNDPTDYVTLPEQMMTNTEDEVINWAFLDENGGLRPFEEIKDTCILTPHNDASIEINEKVAKEL